MICFCWYMFLSKFNFSIQMYALLELNLLFCSDMLIVWQYLHDVKDKITIKGLDFIKGYTTCYKLEVKL